MASGVGTSVAIVVVDGTCVGECLDRVHSGPFDSATEVVLVDLRDDPQARGELRRSAAAHGRAVRVIAAPGASVDEGLGVAAAAARGARTLAYVETTRLPSGLAAELLGLGVDAEAALDDRLDLVRALEQGHVRRSGPESVTGAVDEQAQRIRDLLVSEPDRHREAVFGARQRGIHSLPWAVVNHGRARDLAVLYNFVPFIDTSGLVAARRLREWGVVTDVISQDISSTARIDEAGGAIAADVLDEARMIPGKRQVQRWSSVTGFVGDVLTEVADLQATKGPYRSVYSRAMPPAAHVAAAVLKLRSPGLRWVAEFSDPLLMNAYGETRTGDVEPGWLLAELTDGFRRAGHRVPESRRLFGWAELVAYAFADEIIFTNEHQRDFMLGYCPDTALAERAAGLTRVLHHPVPGPELYTMARPSYPLTEGKIHVGFFGNFYANRALTELTGAIDRLTLVERDRLQVHVFTSKPEELRVELLEQGLADVVRTSPMFGYLEYLNVLGRFDVLLINDYATSPHYVPNPYLPAKLADYLGSGTTIWALYEPGSVLSGVDVEHATPLGDVAAATKVLRELVRQA